MVGLESKRAGFAFVSNAAIAADQIQAIRPRGVSDFGRVVEIVNQSRQLDPQLAHAGRCDVTPLVECARSRDRHVARKLPGIAGVCLENVDDVERRLIFVLAVQLVERGNLPAKWRSSVAAENQDHGFLAAE